MNGIEILDEIINKFAEQMIRANKEELNAINITNAINYLKRTPQIRNLEKIIKAWNVLNEEFDIEAYTTALNHKAISVYSDFDKVAVIKVVSQEKHDLVKEVLENGNRS